MDKEGGTSPWKCYKLFLALVVTVKRSVDDIFMHYFHKLSSASWGLTGALFLDPAGDFRPRPPNFPTPRKNLAGARDSL